jgi:3-phenylpropionate/cinnamic acid dioxygenase small subunit
MTGGRDAEVQRVIDARAVHDLVVRYALALDARDWGLLESCFLPDATYTFPGGESPDRAAIVDRCARALTRLDASQHLVGTIDVRVDGDEATATAYFQAQHVKRGTPGGDLFIVAGTYRDRVVRTPDGWRIAHRDQSYTWTDGNPAVVARAST